MRNGADPTALTWVPSELHEDWRGGLSSGGRRCLPRRIIRDAMKFSALALDYDGTTAVNGVFDPAVREAIGEARRRGIIVILVTGRRLPDLHQDAGELACFDVIVAENGAVLEFPASGRHVLIEHAA